MADAAMWGNVRTLIDNASSRMEPHDDSAYEMPMDLGPAKPRGFGKASMPEDSEPYVVWVLVVGSIVGLLLLSKMFKSAKA